MQKIIDKNSNVIIEAVKRAIAHDTTPDETAEGHPFGIRLSAALDDFLEMASAMGFYTKNIDNYVGYVEIGEGEKLYGILCHLDVVPVGDPADWATPPFHAAIRDGKLYGRGAIDDKGPAVAALFAMKAVKESGVKLNCRIRLILGLDEESGHSRCIEHYLEKEETPIFSFSPDADFPLINAEKGILRASFKKAFNEKGNIKSIRGGTRINVVPALATTIFENGIQITASGKAAHAMQPSKGENAIQKLLSFMANLDFAPSEQKNYFTALHSLFLMETDGAALGIACADDVSGELTLNLGLIEYDGAECTTNVDIRYPVTADYEKIIKTLEEKAAAASAEFAVIQHNPPLYIPEENEYIQVLLGAYEKVTGEKGQPKSTGGGTYCRNVPNSVSFGPLFEGEEESAHTANEYISADSLLKAVNIYAEAILRLNNH